MISATDLAEKSINVQAMANRMMEVRRWWKRKTRGTGKPHITRIEGWNGHYWWLCRDINAAAIGDTQFKSYCNWWKAKR